MRHGIDFFRDEIRNGFYIPTAVKQAWAAELDVLAEIDRICRKHDIRYFADWGTILGAVRHGGFVPWDDDLDICMLRDDYEKFRAVCDEELPESYCIHDYERHPGHWLFLARVVNNRHHCFDEAYLQENYNFPWLSGIDIFVKDYLYSDPAREKKRCDEVMHLLAEAEVYIRAAEQDDNKRSKAIELYRQVEKKMAEVPAKDAEQIGQIFPWVLKGGPGEPLEYYQETAYLPFEDTLIPVPACYNKVLTKRYGEYNVIHKGVAGHDYPSFDAQRRAFEEETGAVLPRFSFDKRMLERPAVNMLNRERREVLFLPIGPSEWKSLEESFKRECADPDTDVYVVPLPLMHRDIYGKIMSTDEEIIEAEHFENYVVILNGLSVEGINTDNVYLAGFTDYDLSQHIPDRIYIQFQYDAHNPVLTIPPYYFADNLRLFTKELIYIPLGPVGEFSAEDTPDIRSMDFYLTMSGSIYADKIWVQSENVRGHYIDKLCEFCAGTDRKYWEEKVIVDETIYAGASSENINDDSMLHEGKKRILYGIATYESAEHPDDYDEKIKSRMDIFAENADKIDVEIIHYPKDCDTENCFEDMRRLVSSFDAYYGSSMPIVQEFVAQKKPVMIANYDI